jgi:hypothetical protein
MTSHCGEQGYIMFLEHSKHTYRAWRLGGIKRRQILIRVVHSALKQKFQGWGGGFDCPQSVWVSFASLWQSTWENQLKGGKVYFDSLFLWFQVMVTLLLCFWACGEGEHPGGKQVVKWLSSWQIGGKEKERDGNGQGHLRTCPSDLLPPTRLYFLTCPPAPKSTITWGN